MNRRLCDEEILLRLEYDPYQEEGYAVSVLVSNTPVRAFRCMSVGLLGFVCVALDNDD